MHENNYVNEPLGWRTNLVFQDTEGILKTQLELSIIRSTFVPNYYLTLDRNNKSNPLLNRELVSMYI